MADTSEAARDYYDLKNSQGANIKPELVVQIWGVDGRPDLPLRLTRAQFEGLHDLLGGLSSPLRELLFNAAVASLPPASTMSMASREPHDLIKALSVLPTSATGWPLFAAVERFALSPKLEVSLVRQLRMWVDKTASELRPPVSAASIAQMRRMLDDEAGVAAQAAVSWLQVFLEPDPANRTLERKQPHFRVELVLWSAKTGGGLVLATPTIDTGRLWLLDELPDLLDAVLADGETMRQIPNARRLVIEIVAPSETLLYGFERWKYLKKAATYGETFPVIVRLSDRHTIPIAIERRRANDLWRDKWQTFRTDLREQGVESLPWFDQEALDFADVDDDAQPVCLGIKGPLASEKAREALDALRDAGIPVALWVRGGDVPPEAPADWHQGLVAKMKDERLCDLHNAVLALRKSKKDPAPLVRALTLLWDDPERPPLKYDDEGVFK
jgi:hypothetical protein